MKQQDANKLMAYFLAFIMLGSVFFYFIFQNIPDQKPEEEINQEKYNPEFWVINQPFDSISDALNITPAGAESASYLNLESMTPQLEQQARQERLIGELDSIYKSNTTRMYYANILVGKNRSDLLLNTMSPELNDFEYMVVQDDPPILRRLDMNGYYNVMGTPVILASGNTIVDVLTIINSLNETVTSHDRYKGILSRVPNAPFQTITSNVTFAKQYYMGIRLNNGSYERTTAYLDLNPSSRKKLNRLSENSTQRGISQYDIKTSGNYTIIQISAKDLLPVMMEVTN